MRRLELDENYKGSDVESWVKARLTESTPFLIPFEIPPCVRKSVIRICLNETWKNSTELDHHWINFSANEEGFIITPIHVSVLDCISQ